MNNSVQAFCGGLSRRYGFYGLWQIDAARTDICRLSITDVSTDSSHIGV